MSVLFYAKMISKKMFINNVYKKWNKTNSTKKKMLKQFSEQNETKCEQHIYDMNCIVYNIA